MNRVCVFCGSNSGSRPVYRKTAVALGRALAQRCIGLVFGGGHVGLMGAIADSVLHAGGAVIGVIPHALVARELAHQHVQDLRVTNSMHERKALMAELADGFIALPGGFGTFEEFCEILTWAQLGLHSKPCGILNVEGYFTHLLAQFNHSIDEGFLPPQHRAWVIESSEPESLLDQMEQFTPPETPKWISPEES